MKNHIYWIDHIFETPAISQEPLPDFCDVAVIGGGFTGLSTALHLTRKTASVCVFESDMIGSGASTRTAGMVLTGFKSPPQELIRHKGIKQAVQLYKTSLAAIDFVETLIQQEDIDCDFNRYGALWAAYSQHHFEDLVETQQLLKETFNHETYVVNRQDLPTELGTKIYHGGLVDPLSAGLNPGKLTYGLLSRTQKSGVKIYEHTPITGLIRQNGHFQLLTPLGRVRATEVVVATNGYTPPFLKFLRRRVIPIGSYIIVSEPLGPALANELIPKGRMVFDTKNLLYYFRLIENNRLLFGGRTSFKRVDDRTAAEKLQQSMGMVFPQIKPFRAEYFWSGNVCYTFDHLPHLGQDGDTYYALGYCGHGVAMSIYAGYALACMIAGESIDVPFTSQKFETRIYYRKNPWFLPLAGVIYKLMDRLVR